MTAITSRPTLPKEDSHCLVCLNPFQEKEAQYTRAGCRHDGFHPGCFLLLIQGQLRRTPDQIFLCDLCKLPISSDSIKALAKMPRWEEDLQAARAQTLWEICKQRVFTCTIAGKTNLTLTTKQICGSAEPKKRAVKKAQEAYEIAKAAQKISQFLDREEKIVRAIKIQCAMHIGGMIALGALVGAYKEGSIRAIKTGLCVAIGSAAGALRAASTKDHKKRSVHTMRNIAAGAVKGADNCAIIAVILHTLYI